MSRETLALAYQDLRNAQSKHNESAVKASRAKLREVRANLLLQENPEAIANMERTILDSMDSIRLQELHNRAKALDALCEAKGIFGPR